MGSKRQKLQDAYVATLCGSAALLTAWKDSLPAERREQLAQFEARDLRLGLTLTFPADRNQWVLAVTLLDPAGGLVTLAQVDPDQSEGGSLSVN